MYPRSYAQYTLLERLASGGMSEVDLARRTVDDAGYVRFLVVKRIKANHVEDESFVRMFKDEARITSALRHTNIAQVYDFGRVEDEYFLALEYVAGTDLRVVLSRLRKARKRMPVRMALKITADVLDALEYAHTRTDTLGKPMNVVHRDVNPRNIMMSVSGEVKLIDFGVARATDRLERTQTDHFKGKIAYMAPEQVTSEDLDHRVDIFAMGLTLYEVLTGRGAFAGLDQTQILYRILQDQLPRLEVPKEWGAPGRSLSDLVGRALAHDRDQRYPTASSMREAVERTVSAFGGMPTQAEFAAWLREVDPGLEDRVRAKLERLAGSLPPEGQIPPLEPPEPSDRSVSLALAPTEPSEPVEIEGARRSPLVVAAAGIGSVTLVLLVLLTVVGLGVLAAIAGVAMLQPGELEPAEVAELEPADDSPADDVPTGPVKPLEVWPPPRPWQGDEADAGGAGTADPPAQPRPRPETAATVTGSVDDDTPDPAASEEGTASTASEPTTDVVEETPSGSADPVTEVEPATPEPAAATEPVATGKLQVTAAIKGLKLRIDGVETPHRTGEQFEWPVGTYTIEADGLSPATVTVKSGLFAFVPLKPEGS